MNVGDGAWFCQYVTDAARDEPDPCGILVIMRDDVFTVISIDDPGPCELLDYSTMSDPFEEAARVRSMRWHVVLLRMALVWIADSWFEQCELLHDAG